MQEEKNRPMRCEQLFVATQNGDVAAIEAAEASDLAGCRDFFSRTLAMTAAFYGHQEVLDILVARGASFDAKDSHGRTLSYYLENFNMASVMERTMARATRDLLDELLKQKP